MSFLEEFRRQRERDIVNYERQARVGEDRVYSFKIDYEGMKRLQKAMENYIPRYFIGYDPYKEDEGGGSSFPVEVMKEYIKGLEPSITNKKVEELKQKKMKTKKFYHTFEYEKRKVTLCLLVEEREQDPYDRLKGKEPQATIKVGYAVCVPDDEFDQDLAKRISSGRAESDKARLKDLSTDSTVEFAFDLGILNASAKIFERKVKRGEVVIKGIRPIKKEQ